MEYAKCKHKISFKLNVLKEDVPSEYAMGKLLTRKKRGRPKCVPPALEILIIDDSDDSDSGDNHDLTEGYPAAPCAI